MAAIEHQLAHVVRMQDEAQMIDTRPSRSRGVVLWTPDHIGGMVAFSFHRYRFRRRARLSCCD
jgi:hypothetical protein